MSELERGKGASSSLETWATVASAVGEQLVGFLERAPGADRPRDLEHLRRQDLVVRTAARGGWHPAPEVAIDPDVHRSRSIDVLLVRGVTAESVVVEVWDWFDDVGAAMRSFDGKVAAVERSYRERSDGIWHTGGIWVVRNTRRNRTLVADLAALFRARFPASSSAWLRALTEAGSAIPEGAGLLWSDVSATRLFPSRLRR